MPSRVPSLPSLSVSRNHSLPSDKQPQDPEKIYADFIKQKVANERVDSALDWSTSRKVQKYLSSAKDIKVEDFQEIKSSANDTADSNDSLSFPALKRMHNILVKIHVSNFQNQYERGCFYEKQSEAGRKPTSSYDS